MIYQTACTNIPYKQIYININIQYIYINYIYITNTYTSERPHLNLLLHSLIYPSHLYTFTFVYIHIFILASHHPHTSDLHLHPQPLRHPPTGDMSMKAVFRLGCLRVLRPCASLRRCATLLPRRGKGSDVTREGDNTGCIWSVFSYDTRL